MSTIPEIAVALRHLLTHTADEIACFNRFVRRRDKPLTGSLFVQTLLLTLLAKPAPALSDYSHTAAARGLRISAQGFDLNFTEQAVDLLRGVFHQMATPTIGAATPLAAGLLARFSAIFVFDSSCIPLPPRLGQLWMGCGNGQPPADGSAATVKLGLGLEVRTGGLCAVELRDGIVPDRLTQGQAHPIPPQAVRLTDLGFFHLERFATIAAGAGYWFSRLQTGVALWTADAQRQELEDLLAAQVGTQVDEWVELGVRARLPARLIAVRVTQEVADNRRRKLRAAARRKGQVVSARRVASADWNVYVTNIPVEQLSVEEAVVLAGVRWQIELLFKLWKSHGRIDEWAASGNHWRVLCEIYGKLRAMLVSHGVLVVSCWADPTRSLRLAAEVVRQYAGGIVLCWDTEGQVVAVLEGLARIIRQTCQMTKRKKQPSTYQLLENPALLANRGALA